MGLQHADQVAADVVGGYRLVRELGWRPGSWVGRRTSDGEPVIVHRIAPQGRPHVVVTDARRALDVDHPSILRVRAVEMSRLDILLVSDYVDGESYSALVATSRERKEPIPLRVTLRIVCDVLAALTAMHDGIAANGGRIGLVHGRLAPVDLLVGTDGVTRLVLASRWARGDESQNVGYFAPEIILTGETEADARTDVYGVGVLLWEALANQRLYDATSSEAVLARQLRGKVAPPPIPRDAPWVEAVGKIALRALSADPKHRYASASAMLDALLAVGGMRVGSADDAASVVEAIAGPFLRARYRELMTSRASFDSEIRTAERDDGEPTLTHDDDDPPDVATEVDLKVPLRDLRKRSAESGTARSAPSTDRRPDGVSHEIAPLESEDGDEPRTEVDVPFSALSSIDRSADEPHPADLDRPTRTVNVPAAAKRTARESREDPSITSTQPSWQREKLRSQSGEDPTESEVSVVTSPTLKKVSPSDDEVITDVLDPQIPKDVYRSPAESITVDVAPSAVDEYSEASITAKQSLGAQLQGDPIPGSDGDIEQAYSQTVTLAKPSPALAHLIAAHATAHRDNKMIPHDEQHAHHEGARGHTAEMPTAPQRSPSGRTVPLGLHPPVFPPAPAMRGGPLDQTESMLLDPSPAAGMYGANVNVGMTAPGLGMQGQAPGVASPMPPSSNAPRPAPVASTTVGTRSHSGSAWLGVLTFFLVLGSLGLIAWLTFPMWREWANL